jgi:hypothetical protein
MTITFSNLITQISYEMVDTSWDDAYVGYWLNMAIRDYSKYFPLVKIQTITTLLNDNQYDLASDFMDVIAVEYPTGETPPQYLSRRAFTQPDFWESDYWYDIIEHKDDTDPDELLISKTTLAADDSIDVHYHGHHALIANPASVTGNCTVPVYHHNLLSLYVFWQNALSLANTEQQSPTSSSSLLMAQLAQNARRAENAYHVALQQALYADRGKSRPVQWVDGGDSRSNDDSMARIY